MQYAMLGTTEVVVIVLVVLVLFGAKKIPEFAKGLGKGLKEFKDAKNDIKETIDSDSKN
jgi:sec-independent protein translocase protein TatA|tara:strand:- start:401 stop:577 length:177 start_codon:yes stop_codon:yes gene_type:complete